MEVPRKLKVFHDFLDISATQVIKVTKSGNKGHKMGEGNRKLSNFLILSSLEDYQEQYLINRPRKNPFSSAPVQVQKKWLNLFYVVQLLNFAICYSCSPIT